MPRDGAIIFSDLIGKLDLIRVACDKCGRDGCYGLSRLIDKRGRDAKVIDWLDELTADCPKKIAHNMNDPCGHSFKKVGGVPKPPPPPPPPTPPPPLPGIRTSR